MRGSNGYTQTDNWLFEYVMPRAKPNTFKVVAVVMRMTKGWHQTSAYLTFEDLHELTGIAGRGTLNRSIKDAIKQGFIGRQKSGRGHVYSLKIVPFTSTISRPQEAGTVSKSYREQYQNDTANSTKMIPSTSGSKERERKYKEKGGSPPTPPRPQPDLALAAMVNALVDATGRDGHLFFNELSQFAGDLMAGGYTPDQVVRHFGRQPPGDTPAWSWYEHDWRGRRGDLPTPRQVLELISGATKAEKVNNDVSEWTPTTPEDFEWLAAIRANGAAPH